MRKFFMTLLFCSSLATGVAWAAQPPPAPKSDADAIAADDSNPPADEVVIEHKPKKHHKKKAVDSDADEGIIKEENKMEIGDLLEGDRRIRMLLYDETDVYTITTRYGYQTNIVFSPQEEIELISVGDRSLWQIIPTGNRLFIRPMEEDVITNMTVLTNKHSYQFDLKSLSADKSGNIYVAQFVYPDPKHHNPMMEMPSPVAATVPVQVASPPPLASSGPFGVGPSVSNRLVSAPTSLVPQAAEAATPAAPNYRYTYSGPDDLAPLQVYDDGHSTYLKYPDIGKLAPNVFIVDPSGRENPVNYTLQGDYMVVDAVAGELAVRSNGAVVHVFNEMLNPG